MKYCKKCKCETEQGWKDECAICSKTLKELKDYNIDISKVDEWKIDMLVSLDKNIEKLDKDLKVLKYVKIALFGCLAIALGVLMVVKIG